MANAIKIATLDSSLNPQGTFWFEGKESADGQVSPHVEWVEQRAQNGKPTFFIKHTTDSIYRNGVLQIRVHGQSTLTDLLNIRNHIIGGNLVRIYPRWRDAVGLYYDAFLEPDIIEQSVFSGFQKGGDYVSLKFHEVILGGYTIPVFDELPDY